ncbi:MAG: UDP-N-acetylmuramoyl-L-alanine--D-glutamate ligase [Desulfomonilia bacterium]
MRVVVWGTGETGIMTAHEMIRQGHEVRLVDEHMPERALEIPVKQMEIADLRWADLVIPSPGVPRSHPLFTYASRVLSEVEVASALLTGRIIAITGTNGKTTTTTLIYSILHEAGFDVEIGGNISPPLISLVEKNSSWIVAEISSFQLEWIESFKPFISVCMNITADHLDRYRDMEEYVYYKLKIFENQTGENIAVINDGDPYLKGIDLRARTAGFSLRPPSTQDGAYLEGDRIRFQGSISGAGPRIPDPRVIGGGVVEDMIASALVCRLLDVNTSVMERVFSAFKVIHHRFEHVATVNDITFIDDSKATNVGALDKALSNLDGSVVLILGGKDKGGDFSQIARTYRNKIKKAFVMGEAGPRITAEISPYVDTESARDMDDAVLGAYRIARRGDTVLLSPGCASFDMYTSYAHRGDVFRQCVDSVLKTMK